MLEAANRAKTVPALGELMLAWVGVLRGGYSMFMGNKALSNESGPKVIHLRQFCLNHLFERHPVRHQIQNKSPRVKDGKLSGRTVGFGIRST